MEEILEKCDNAREEILTLNNKEIENLINGIKIQLTENIDIIEDAYKGDLIDLREEYGLKFNDEYILNQYNNAVNNWLYGE